MCVEKNRVHKCSLQNRHAHLQGIITSVHKAGSPRGQCMVRVWSMGGARGLSGSAVFLHKSQVKDVIQEILGTVKFKGCGDKK